MASNDKARTDEARFGFGAGGDDKRQAKPPQTLAFDARKKDKTEDQGFDPYNTSGSFDRKKNWVRVGKR